MRSIRSTIAAAFLLSGIIVIGNIVIAAQSPPDSRDMEIDSAARSAVIDAALENINNSYVFPEVAKQMEKHVRALQKNGEYDSISSGREFAARLTKDLQSISKDKHLNLRFSYDPLPVRSRNDRPSEEEIERRNRFMERVNYGFETVQRLEGNVGYIEFRGFFDAEAGAETVAAAMNFVANTDALIFDLRRNGGGSPAMVALICSYLFGEEKVHLNDLYWREGDRTDEFWTMPEKVKAPHYVGKDVYVLTSGRTFSGAEEFSYNLKNLKRATIVGETTGGGAHPGGVYRLTDHFNIFISTGRAISPITKTNWEGTGVIPDVPVAKELALETAYKMALEKSLAKAETESDKAALKQLIHDTEMKLKKQEKAVASSH
ncbi:MAG: peptidase [Acidobacteria bacterium]|nr:MAG: peptidase [Acidobacteriota bacterium]REK02474.1 MAG: peptidase [Acidobacteriota bacterium]REK13724.1 MAG: peptidase [Acidobacteriota bacterium]REK41718.1 MAG: peptidase [Acidobacteriota bacterium]